MTKHALHYSSSPLLSSATPLWRSKALVAFVALAFLGLVARAGYIQLVNPSFYVGEGEKRYARTLTLPAKRGRILDRNGVPLASSVKAKAVWVDRTQLFAYRDDLQANEPEKWPEAKQQQSNVVRMAKLLGMSMPQLKRKAKRSKYVRLARQVDDKVAQQIADMGVKGVTLEDEYKRWYPDSEAFVQVVGLTNIDGKGQNGMERMMQERLAGKEGSRRVIHNSLRKVVEDVGYTRPAEQGEDVTLSIDSKIQHQAYEYLKETVRTKKAKQGSVVVMDVQTGEVLAMSNYPSFNPSDAEWRRRISSQDLAERIRNRALWDQVEPGSTIKPFTVAAALDKGSFRPQDQIDTGKGSIKFDRFTIRDTSRHGVISVSEVIEMSSNVGAVKISKSLTPYEFWSVLNHAGFGQKPEVEFPLSASGALRPYKDWSDVDKYSISYGYGLSASVFQLAHAYTVFANDGVLVPATLLKTEHRRPGVQVVSPSTARDVRQMLYSVVQGKEGTGKRAQPEGYYAGGKTGTVRKLMKGKYSRKHYRTFFVGLAPIDTPRIAVAVMVDDPEFGQHYAGKSAAPLFAKVAHFTLANMGVVPERDVDIKHASASVASGLSRAAEGASESMAVGGGAL